MGGGHSKPGTLRTCLDNVCEGRRHCVAYDGHPLYEIKWAQKFNIDLDNRYPGAVIRPETTQDVSQIIRCAADHNATIQAKGGGHSYANFALDADITIDLINMAHVSVENNTGVARIGGGSRLGKIDEVLHHHGRALAHGVCPGVGIGGHATIDHVVEAEVVTVDGSVVRANEGQNADLFFAVRGAAAGFGVVTEFVMQTHPSPGKVIQYAYVYSFGGPKDLASVYMQWQDVATDPTLDRRFGTDLTFHALGAMISGTFYGSKTDFEQSGILERLPRGGMGNYVVTSWLASVVTRAEHAAIRLSNLPTPFYCKSLGLTRQDLLSYNAILNIVDFVDSAEKRTPLWFIIFSATGGAVSDVPMNATAYAHRDKVVFYESYVVGIPFIPGGLPRSDHKFLSDLHEVVRSNLPHATDPYGRTYPGYVDRELPDESAQKYYWGNNLQRLQQIKRKWDPKDLFHNEHSVRPAEKSTGENGGSG